MLKDADKQILPRIKNEAARNAAAEFFVINEKLTARIAQLVRSGEYSQPGLQKEIRRVLTEEFAPALRKAQIPIARMMMDADRRLKELAMPAPDPNTWHERRELRDHIKTLPPHERLPFVLKSKDQRFVEAVLSMPAALSGFTDSDFEVLRNDRQETFHGPVYKEIIAQQDDAAEANVAFQVVQGDMLRSSGLQENQFTEIMHKRRKNETPWLLRDGDRILVVQVGKGGVYPDATADDLASGKFYANQAEYQKDHAANAPA